MKEMNMDWCYEGGCTYLADADAMPESEPDNTELEAMYREPCIAMFD